MRASVSEGSAEEESVEDGVIGRVEVLREEGLVDEDAFDLRRAVSSLLDDAAVSGFSPLTARGVDELATGLRATADVRGGGGAGGCLA